MEKRTASPRTAPPTSPPASEPTGSSPTSEATTTTAPPQRPTGDDVELLAFAQSVELTAHDLYQSALDAGLADGEFADVFSDAAREPRGVRQPAVGHLGRRCARHRDDALFDDLVGAFDSSDTQAVATAGFDLEATAVATHRDLLGRVRGIDGVAALASIVVVEARHGTVLADVAGNGDDLDAMLTADAEALAAPRAVGLEERLRWTIAACPAGGCSSSALRRWASPPCSPPAATTRRRPQDVSAMPRRRPTSPARRSTTTSTCAP